MLPLQCHANNAWIHNTSSMQIIHRPESLPPKEEARCKLERFRPSESHHDRLPPIAPPSQPIRALNGWSNRTSPAQGLAQVTTAPNNDEEAPHLASALSTTPRRCQCPAPTTPSLSHHVPVPLYSIQEPRTHCRLAVVNQTSHEEDSSGARHRGVARDS